MDDQSLNAAHHQVDRALRVDGRSGGGMAGAIRAVAAVAGEARSRIAMAVAREAASGVRRDAAAIALRLAADVALQSDPDAPPAQREGRFDQLDPTQAAVVRQGIETGWPISARDRHRLVELARDEAASVDLASAAPALARDLGIAEGEWAQPGQRGDAAYLLHVQIPALVALRDGADAPTAGANADAIASEMHNIRRHGAGGPNGIETNLRAATELSRWARSGLTDEGVEAADGLAASIRLATTLGRQRPGIGGSMGIAA